MMGVGILALIGKLHKWDESAMFFDGGSLGTPSPANPCSRTYVLITSAFLAPSFGLALIPARTVCCTRTKRRTYSVLRCTRP